MTLIELHKQMKGTSKEKWAKAHEGTSLHEFFAAEADSLKFFFKSFYAILNVNKLKNIKLALYRT